jgi:hypothetical protein
MQTTQERIRTDQYRKCIEASKRIRWDIDRDVIRGREFDFSRKFLPDGLSQVSRLDMLNPLEQRVLSQVQGRTYANMFGLVERFIGAKLLEISREYWLGDQSALESLVRSTDEELKHQELFRRLEGMMAKQMAAGYTFLPKPNDVAEFVLGKSTWSVLALTCLIEIFTLVHYRQSIEPQGDLSPLWKDVFLFHAKEEAQHAILDELEWAREDAKLSDAERDSATDDLIALAAGVDGILQMQAMADADYFFNLCPRNFSPTEAEAIRAGILRAYRWQYIVSGVQDQRFITALSQKITPQQMERIGAALTPILS